MQDKFSLTRKENIFLAKKLLVRSVYNSALLEGINVTFPDTQTIMDGQTVSNMDVDDLQKIVNLRNAWRYTLGNIGEPTGLDLMKKINAFVSYNESIEWGVLRTGEVGIGGAEWRPPVPQEEDVLRALEKIETDPCCDSDTDRALTLWAYAMRSQLFWDGNKRTALLAANHYMIAHGRGILTVPKEEIPEFNRALVAFYDSEDYAAFKAYAWEHCIQGMSRG